MFFITFNAIDIGVLYLCDRQCILSYTHRSFDFLRTINKSALEKKTQLMFKFTHSSLLSVYRASSQADAEDKFNAFVQRLPVFVTISKDVSIHRTYTYIYLLRAVHTHVMVSNKYYSSTDVQRGRFAKDLRRAHGESVLVNWTFGGLLQSDRSGGQCEGARSDRLSGSRESDDSVSGELLIKYTTTVEL